ADPARREALLAGAAAPAAAVFAGDAAVPESGGDGSFAVLQGRFWLTLNLAAERPLVLAVDDLHWCDRPSLRFLAYLVRRLEGVPILVAATLRTGERPTDPAMLDEILHDPAAVAVRPGPLSLGAARVVVRARLGADAADAFCAACHETTGGNPLLLRQLLTALQTDAVRPTAENVAVVRRIGPRAVSRTIGLRLARMSPETVSVARAIAVLGERAELPTVAALAGIDEGVAGRAVAALARAEVLRPERPLGFVHPLVRDAVYGELPVGEVEVQHAQAARVLAEAGAPDDVVAVHLMLAPRRGDEWAVGVLQGAGRSAARQGAADSAVALLRRALEEPPPPAVRPGLLLDLGLTEKLVDGLAAAEHLRAAHDELRDPKLRAQAAYALAWTLFFVGNPEETAAFQRQAAEEQPPELLDMRWALEALSLLTSLGHGVDLAEYEERLRHFREEGAPTGTGAGAKMLLAVSAWGWAVTGGPSDQCAAIARRAFDGPELIEVDDGLVIVAGMAVLVLSDRPEAMDVWDAALAEAHRSGSLFLTCTVHIWRGWTLVWRGELDEAETSIEQGIEELALWGSGAAIMGYPAAFLAMARIEQGDYAGARAAIARGGTPPPGADAGRFLLTAEVEVLLAEGRPEEGLRLAERVEQASARHNNPGWAGWRSLKARCLAAVGRHEEAVALAVAEVEVARRWGGPGVVGRALRVLATIEGDGRIERFEESVALLEGTPSRLELAKSLAALGGALRRAGRGPEARGPLARALVLAEASGAHALAE
ncbi:MAG TPA: hypothetical protein VF533_08920, partial [Solirubrobacteraceae bacterium]